jgi:hypothetical protein
MTGETVTTTRPSLYVALQIDSIERTDADRVLAIKAGDLEIPWPEGLTFKHALLAWKEGT